MISIPHSSFLGAGRERTPLFIKYEKQLIRYIWYTVTFAFNQFKVKLLMDRWTCQNIIPLQYIIQDYIYKMHVWSFLTKESRKREGNYSPKIKVISFSSPPHLLKSYLHLRGIARIFFYTTKLKILAQNHNCFIGHLIFQVHSIKDPKY